MGNLGVSVFIGMGQTLAENSAYLKLAAQFGYNRLFTSLHIPEADPTAFLREGKELLILAATLGFSVTADISPRTWQLMELSPEELRKYGISALRADWGFSPEQLRDLIGRSGLRLEINASTADEFLIDRLSAAGLDPAQICACHNYYPRPETGLSYDLFCRRSRSLAARGIPVAAFLPGKTSLRGPIFAGLPTLEAHRQMATMDSIRQFWTSGCVDAVLFGDPLVTAAELAVAAEVPQAAPEMLELQAKAVLPQEYGSAVLWLSTHTNRMDASGLVIRSQESRNLNPEAIKPQETAVLRRRGDITVDNSLYGRYAGEMQIVLQALPADVRVNVVGRIADQDMCLLDCLEPGRKFCLKEEYG